MEITGSTANYFLRDWLVNNSLFKSDSDQNNNISYPLVYVDKNKSSYTYATKHGIISYSYDNLNKDKKTIKTITKYYYYKILDKWLYKDLLPLLGFVEIVDNKPKLLNSLDDFNGEKLLKESKQELQKKINYMEEILINKLLVKHVLKKIISKYNINWAELEDNVPKIKKYFFNYLKDKIEYVITGKK
jgi:hypothetical protein